MTSDLALMLLLFSVVPGVVGWIARKAMPRLAMFLFGIPISLLGIWMVLSTLELEKRGLAHTFSRHNTVFSKVESPVAFEWSFWFHFCLGGMMMLLGMLCLVLPLTRHGSRTKFNR